jgi:hypothetical protein
LPPDRTISAVLAAWTLLETEVPSEKLNWKVRVSGLLLSWPVRNR